MASILPACGSPPATGTDSTTTDATGTETGAETGAETETGTTEPTTTMGFPPPVADLPPSCDPFMQNCAEGEKCVPYSSSGGNWDANKCVPVLGDQTIGDPCVHDGVTAGTDNCDATSLCWNTTLVDDELVGTCHPFCSGTPDDPECPDEYTCPLAGDGSVTVCIPVCDPVAQDCGPGLGCYWGNSRFYCIFTSADIAAGEPCGFINDCAPGNVCVSSEALPQCEGAACCTLFCDLELGDGQCEALPGTSCVAFFEQGTAPPEFEHVGFCITP